jgi:hypothetical protein
MGLPAAITFRHSAVSATAITGITFNPLTHAFPDNISGRSCIMECNVFSFDASAPPTTPISSDAYILTCTLPQPYSRVMTTSNTIVGRSVIGVMKNSQCYSCGPILVNVPEGPVDMSFTVVRADGGELCGANSTNTVLISLTITPVE